MANRQRRQVDYIPVEDLNFDPNNPRLPSSVDKTNDAEVFEFMIRQANVIELMGSIGEQGYFPGEPLLVVPDSENNGTYSVIEGNRRLAAVKLLLNPELAPAKTASIREVSKDAPMLDDLRSGLAAIEYDKREEILEYLGYRHITGIQTWGAWAKARYLDQLAQQKRHESGGKLKDKQVDTILAKEIGSRSDYVGRLLASHAVTNKIAEAGYFDILGLDEESIEFGTLSTALSYTNLSRFIGLEDTRDRQLESLDMERLETLTRWIFSHDTEGRTRLGESRDLKMLDAVVGSQEALEKFEAGIPLEEAYRFSKGPAESFWQAIADAKVSIDLAWERLPEVQTFVPSELSVLEEVAKSARLMFVGIRDRLILDE